jgi:predicted amidohydrolase YtcJ
LNAVAPDNPVLLGHASGHAALVNRAALARAGIGDLTADPAGGTIVRDSNGKATGLLRETAQRLVRRELAAERARRNPQEIEREKREWVRLAAEASLANGITSFQDAGTSFADIDIFHRLEVLGQLPVRLYVMVRFESNEAMARRLPDYRMPYEENDFLVVRSIKSQVDGALGSHGAWLLQPYVDLPDTSGLVLEPLDNIRLTAELALQHGFQLSTHAIGDRGNREMLDLYQRAFQAGGQPGGPLRWRIEHAQHIDPADVPRFGDLGVIAAVQGVHATSDGPWLPTRLGQQRTEATSYPWRDLIDSGAVVTNGTDVPVERIDPIASFYASVSRKMNNGERLTPQQAMTRMEAIRSYTINNAFAAFEEDVKGSLAPGKLADIVVLSQNLLEVPEERIPETKVEMTVVGGQVAYRRSGD